jgi:hypothetical protein
MELKRHAKYKKRKPVTEDKIDELFILKSRLVVGTVVALILVAFTPIIDIDVSSSFEVNYNEPAPTYEALSPSLAEVKLMDRKNELIEQLDRMGD